MESIFYIDLVFYNYILKCFVLIDLKTGKLTHQDIGQMQMYVNYYSLELINEGDGKPEIFNTDQGSQFTSNEFQNILCQNGIEASMDGKGRSIDNIYIERYFRTLKYEDIYLNNYETIQEARIGIMKFTHFYNTERFHSSLEYKTPDEVYFNNERLEKDNCGICLADKHHSQNNDDVLNLQPAGKGL